MGQDPHGFGRAGSAVERVLPAVEVVQDRGHESKGNVVAAEVGNDYSMVVEFGGPDAYRPKRLPSDRERQRLPLNSVEGALRPRAAGS